MSMTGKVSQTLLKRVYVAAQKLPVVKTTYATPGSALDKGLNKVLGFYDQTQRLQYLEVKSQGSFDYDRPYSRYHSRSTSILDLLFTQSGAEKIRGWADGLRRFTVAILGLTDISKIVNAISNEDIDTEIKWAFRSYSLENQTKAIEASLVIHRDPSIIARFFTQLPHHILAPIFREMPNKTVISIVEHMPPATVEGIFVFMANKNPDWQETAKHLFMLLNFKSGQLTEVHRYFQEDSKYQEMRTKLGLAVPKDALKCQHS